MNAEELLKSVEPYVNKPYRVYHGMDHIKDIIESVNNDSSLTSEGKILGTLFAIYHDVVYEPWNTDNEERSIEFMKENMPSEYESYKPKLEALIHDTKYVWKSYKDLPEWSWQIVRHDIKGLNKSDNIMVDELKVFKEYQFVDWNVYKEKRIKVLQNFSTKIPENNNIDERINFLKNFTPKIGVFPGSFSPFTIGHKNILEKAERVFDKVIIAAGINGEKNLNRDGLLTEIKKSVVYRQVESYDTLLTSYLDSKSYPVTLIRGLRNGADLPYEQNLANVLRDVKGSPLDIVYIVCDREYEYISSSAVRQLKQFGIDGMYI